MEEPNISKSEGPQAHKRTKEHPRKHAAYRVVLVIFSVIALAFFGGWAGAYVYLKNPNALKGSTEQAREVVSSESELISSIAQNVGKSVVSISAEEEVDNGFFGTATQASAGTGFIISKDGYVVTNRHVIPERATTVTVILSDGTELKNVEVVGATNADDTLDIAFLKIKDTKGKQLTPAKLGDSKEMQVGDMVVAIGNALGQFQNSVTSGIISGYGRSVQAQGSEGGIENLQNLFQTDAAINQGNSGGPLVNADGEVIGINTAVAGDAENIGFAIPINDVQGLIKGILEKGELLRPYLGVRYIQLSPDIAGELGVKETEGAYISENSGSQASIVKGSPAEKADLQPKDIITKINNQKINQTNSLSSVIGRFAVGDKITVTYIRDGQTKTVDVVLEAAPSS